MLFNEGNEVTTPSLVFTGLYYPQILRELLRYQQFNAPELSSRDPSDPAIQIQRSFAAGLHYFACLLDHVAMESLPGTARMVESVREHLAPIGYKLALAVPSTVDLLATLDGFLSDELTIISTGSLFETLADGSDAEPICFEYVYPSSVKIGPTNVLTGARSLTSYAEPLTTGSVLSSDPDLFTKTGGPDFTSAHVGCAIFIDGSELNNGGMYFIYEVIDTDTVYVYNGDFATESNLRWSLKTWSDDKKVLINNTPGSWNPWSDSGVLPQPGDILYFGQKDVMWDRIDFKFDVYGYGLSGVFEYYDGSMNESNPDTVVVGEATVDFELTTLLGDANHRNSEIHIEYLPTGAKEVAYSYFSNGKNRVSSKSLFGQSSSVSTRIDDYSVGCYWQVPDLIVDRSQNLSMSGRVTFEIPQSVSRNWSKTSIGSHNAYWIRYRIIDLVVPHGDSDDANAYSMDTAVNLEQSIGVANDLKGRYNQHIAVTGLVHKASSSDVIEEDDATDEDSLVLLLNEMKSKFNAHFASTDSHFAEDDTNPVIIDDADANDDASWITLVNSLKNSLNGHVMSVPPSSPSMKKVTIHEGKQYLLFAAVQGESVIDNPLGSSNGLPSQRFKIYRNSLIEGTINVDIDEAGDGNWVRWTNVEHFLSSMTSDRHYTVTVNGDDDAYVNFGGNLRQDGINRYGRIPPLGINNVRSSYRRMDSEQNGNVGANTIVTMRSGTAFVQTITNPRPASGWAAREGSTPESLEEAKVRSAENVKANGRAVSVSDIVAMAVNWKDTITNSKPIARAFAIEEAFGPKTVGLWVVGKGGGYLTTDELQRLETYFNGDNVSIPPVAGVGVANTMTIVGNYKKRKIGVVAITKGGDTSVIMRELAALIHPLKKYSDGVSYMWTQGDELPPSRIIEVIHGISESIRSVELVGFDSPIPFGEEELPIFDPTTSSITNIEE